MQPVTAVVYGVGAMGAAVTRMLADRGVTIVGAIARSPTKVGRDLGQVANLGRDLGVTVGDDPDAVLEGRRVDVAVLAISSHMADHAEHIATCLRHGVNVVTIAEEAFFPWWTSPAATARLDALARVNGVSVLGTGHQDALWVGIGAQLLGAAGRVDEVRWSTLWNPDGSGPELLEAMGIGEPPGAADEGGHAHADGPSFAVAAVDALAANLGMAAGRRTTTSELVLADRPVPCVSLGRTIEAGSVIGVRDIVRREGEGEPDLTFTMTGRLLHEGERTGERWEVVGEPNLQLSNTYDGEHVQVIAQAVHRIPDVIAARPGWLTHDDLPPLRHRRRIINIDQES
jgi:4-hydroxy-tetrahydrodipicolinate reductase